MKKIKELSFKDFRGIIEFLRDLGKKKQTGEISGKNEINEFVLKQIEKFFPTLNMTQTLQMNHLIDSLSESEYNAFRNEYPDLDFDETGRSKPVKKEYWEITLETLDQIYNFAKENNNPASVQVIDAMELANLKTKKYLGYIASRKFFIERFQNLANIFLSSEAFFKEYFGAEKTSIIMGQFAGYCLSEKTKKFQMFADHFLRRVQCLSQEFLSKSSITNEKNVKFLKNIESVIQQYFIKSDT